LDEDLFAAPDTMVSDDWSDELIDQFDRMLAPHGLEVVIYGDTDDLIWKIEKRLPKTA
jgi:hypothetical protein